MTLLTKHHHSCVSPCFPHDSFSALVLPHPDDRRRHVDAHTAVPVSQPCQPISNRIRHQTGQPEGFRVSFSEFLPLPPPTLTARLTSPPIIVISLFFLAGGLTLLSLRNKVNVWPACFVLPFVSSAGFDWFRAFLPPCLDHLLRSSAESSNSRVCCESVTLQYSSSLRRCSLKVIYFDKCSAN